MNDEVRVWQDGNGPAPRGYYIGCTGCSQCQAEGHVLLRDAIAAQDARLERRREAIVAAEKRERMAKLMAEASHLPVPMFSAEHDAQ